MSIFVSRRQHEEKMTLSLIIGVILDWDLAAGFPLNSGSWNVTLPDNLATRSDYIVVVFGNSGNASPKFTIQSR